VTRTVRPPSCTRSTAAAFGFKKFAYVWKTPTQADVENQSAANYKRCVEIFKKTWVKLNPKVSTVAQLAFEIERFSATALRFVYTKTSYLKHAPPRTIWLAVFTAVAESKIHPTDQVNEAINLLNASMLTKSGALEVDVCASSRMVRS
jgi:hypothetical protein